VYITVAVALPDVEYAFAPIVPNEPEPLDAATISRCAAVADEALLLAPVYALCVGFAVTDACVDVAGAESSATPRTIVSPAAAVEGRFRTTGT
jgi:hypothetical protein